VTEHDGRRRAEHRVAGGHVREGRGGVALELVRPPEVPLIEVGHLVPRGGPGPVADGGAEEQLVDGGDRSYRIKRILHIPRGDARIEYSN